MVCIVALLCLANIRIGDTHANDSDVELGQQDMLHAQRDPIPMPRQEPQRALLVTKHWLDQILAGDKRIEVRNGEHKASGHIYLAETKTGIVRACAQLEPARPLTAAECDLYKHFLTNKNYKRPMAWPLFDVVPLAEPWTFSGKARQGCVIWIPRSRWEQYPAGCDVEDGAKHATSMACTSDAESQRSVASIAGSHTSSQGGRGRDTTLTLARDLLSVCSEPEVRKQMKLMGFKPSNITKVIDGLFVCWMSAL